MEIGGKRVDVVEASRYKGQVGEARVTDVSVGDGIRSRNGRGAATR